MSLPFLTDDEIADICRPLKQKAARVRFLRDQLRLPVDERPDGSPIVRRADWDRRSASETEGPAATRGPKWTVPA